MEQQVCRAGFARLKAMRFPARENRRPARRTPRGSLDVCCSAVVCPNVDRAVGPTRRRGYGCSATLQGASPSPFPRPPSPPPRGCARGPAPPRGFPCPAALRVAGAAGAAGAVAAQFLPALPLAPPRPPASVLPARRRRLGSSLSFLA